MLNKYTCACGSPERFRASLAAEMAATVKEPQYLIVGPRQGVYCRPPVVLNTWASQRSYPPHDSAAASRIRWRVSQFRSPDYNYRLRERVEQLPSEHMPTLPPSQQIQGQVIKRPSVPSTKESRPPNRLQPSRSSTSLSSTSLLRHSKLSRSTSRLNVEGAQKSSTVPFSVQACAITIQSRPPQKSVVRKRVVSPSEPFPYPDPATLNGDQAFTVRLAELARLERDTVKNEELRARLASRTVPTLTASSQKSEHPVRPSSARGNRSSPTRVAGRRTSVPAYDRLSRSVNGSLPNRRSSMSSTVGDKSAATAQHNRHSHHNSLNVAREENCNPRSPSPSCATTHSQCGSKLSVMEECTESVAQRVAERETNERETGSNSIGEWKVIANINNHPVEVTLLGGREQNNSGDGGYSKNSTNVESNNTGEQERELHLTGKTTEPANFVEEKEREVGCEGKSQCATEEKRGESDPAERDSTSSLKDSDSASPSPSIATSPPVNTSPKHSATKPAQRGYSSKPASQAAVSSSPRQTTPPTDGSSHSSTSSSSLASERSERSAHTRTHRSKSHRSPTKSGRSKKHSTKPGRLKRENHQ